MQTFLPFTQFSRTAEVLDYQRLGKQRVEAKQIYLALTQPGYGWQHHPAVRMWRGCEAMLLLYGYTVSCIWRDRGYNDTLRDYFWAQLNNYTMTQQGTAPAWLGDTAFHRSHQSNLIRKNAAHYAPLFPGVPADLPYVWPKAV